MALPHASLHNAPDPSVAAGSANQMHGSSAAQLSPSYGCCVQLVNVVVTVDAQNPTHVPDRLLSHVQVLPNAAPASQNV
ncbi:MAG: hypothetical protein Q8O99_05790 [bacterium]|nr:hypothetical protein [bacterium]